VGLNVLNVAFPFTPVTADAAGGAEQVLRWIDQSLHDRGHQSMVIGAQGSRVCGELIATPVATSGQIDAAAWHLAHEAYRRAIATALRSRPIDVIHMHGIDFPAYLPDSAVPVVATLHLPVGWYNPAVFACARPRLLLACVSDAQRLTMPTTQCRVTVVTNGVPLDELRCSRIPRRRFVLVVSRICPEKGIHLALNAARRARVPLLLAGRVFGFDAHRRYYLAAVAPHLDQTRRFVGAVGPQRKRQLLSAARCVLVPSLAPETSSLVAMEAMACGTPVVAFASGALSEIVEGGVTGYLVNSVEEMAEAIAAVDRIDPAACRARAESRFSADRMTAEYLGLYRAIARQ
jgi:glycosyltransferase involved in cell wall biosynthesis